MRISDWSSDVCSSDLWPESVAARVLDEPTPWDVVTHLMQRASPASWEMIVAADPLADGNRQAIQACRAAPTKATTPVRCTTATTSEHSRILRGPDPEHFAIVTMGWTHVGEAALHVTEKEDYRVRVGV